MFISLNWLKDFVDLPSNIDPRELALKFTLTTAEVEGVERVEANFKGLVAAKIETVEIMPEQHPATQTGKLRRVAVQADRQYTSLTSAPDIKVGDVVIYAPPGAVIAGHAIGTTDTAGRPSEGMIVAGQSIDLIQVGANAVFLPPSFEPGRSIETGPFNDWIIEIDNKSVTHRPDCWGHYGIAREIAVMLGLPLRPYPITNPAELHRPDLPAVPIEIDDPEKCPRYTALVMKGLRAQPAPLWMQVRLALCGQRPIDLLVDLTNYIMLELGQPMHAFDGARLPNIQVATAAAGERFITLDGMTRKMPPGALMIQCNRKSVAIAGIMGGAETEVTAQTDTVLLESANFDAATIRRAATAMGHRTEASARFEKSLDPANTVMGIARFHLLAKAELPGLQLASALSDCYPAPRTIEPIELDCDFAARFIGKAVSREEIARILTALAFGCEPAGGAKLRVMPPSYRATKDIEIEADLIEEVARFVGYNNIEPVLPVVSARYFEPSTDLAIERRTLENLCDGGEFVEVHDYIWYDDNWLAKLGFDPGECLRLKNPAADNCARFRKTLMPGLIAMAEGNRHHFTRFQLAEIGSVFEADHSTVEESQHRSLGLVAVQAGAKADGAVWDRLHIALEGWARQVLESRLDYRETKACYPWEDTDRVAEVVVAGRTVGRVTILPLTCKQKIDERLKAWSIALAEVNLSALSDLTERYEKLPVVPRYPQVRLDFSFLVDAAQRYTQVERQLGGFKHALLKRLSFVGSFEGGSVPEGKRSLTLRAEIGRDDRTLNEEEIHGFQADFKGFLSSHKMELRG
ncbi:MAG TPA: phenylalanine--tRNA ligase subunit beta [Phycisphaerae bacterium]|nr:phenylalanine--tRNA ligase subunit beta [Phycisphaerae bacterium]